MFIDIPSLLTISLGIFVVGLMMIINGHKGVINERANSERDRGHKTKRP